MSNWGVLSYQQICAIAAQMRICSEYSTRLRTQNHVEGIVLSDIRIVFNSSYYDSDEFPTPTPVNIGM